MKENLEDSFFDMLLRTLNYAMEFVSARSYASLRFMDLFSSLLELQPLIKGISNGEFYEKLREKIKTRRLMGDRKVRLKLQSELLQMFVDEWSKRMSQK